METSMEAAEVENETEFRGYELNRTKAIHKKLSATKIQMLTVTETGGGVKFAFSTGMYELFKLAADEYFMSDSMKTHCKKITVSDKNNAVVETKYKVNVNTGQYTVNMYHTRCSCLVNGKRTSQSVTSDVNDFISKVGKHLSEENCTIEQFNKHIRDMISGYCAQQSVSSESAESTSRLCLTEPASSMDSGGNSTEVTNGGNVNVVMNTCMSDKSSQTEQENITNGMDELMNKPGISLADLYRQILNINLVLKDVKQTLENHTCDTNQQFSQLLDDIANVKKQSSVNNSVTNGYIEDISGKNTQLHDEISKMSNTMQKWLQSIFDTLKRIKLTADSSVTVNEETKRKVVYDSSQKTETVLPENEPIMWI